MNGTVLTYDPPIPGAPTTLSLGQSVSFETVNPFKIASQDADHPFYVGQIMTGEGVPGNEALMLGDEEFVNILPPAQWLQKYVFFTDPTYPTTNLVLVRVNNGGGFQDVNVDCIGAVSGWHPVGDGSKYEMTDVDLIRNGAPNGTCSNGPHTADSKGQFGLMVWGLAYFSSYAYPAGGNAASINTVVVPPCRSEWLCAAARHHVARCARPAHHGRRPAFAPPTAAQPTQMSSMAVFTLSLSLVGSVRRAMARRFSPT